MMYIIRGGAKKGKYLRLARRAVQGRKYSWTHSRSDAAILTASQAKGVVRRYEGAEAVSVSR